MIGAVALAALVALGIRALRLRTALPTMGVLPADASARIGYEQMQHSFGDGAPRALQIVARRP
jgi:RND superfamily putative drug exporter